MEVLARGLDVREPLLQKRERHAVDARVGRGHGLFDEPQARIDHLVGVDAALVEEFRLLLDRRCPAAPPGEGG